MLGKKYKIKAKPTKSKWSRDPEGDWKLEIVLPAPPGLACSLALSAVGHTGLPARRARPASLPPRGGAIQQSARPLGPSPSQSRRKDVQAHSPSRDACLKEALVSKHPMLASRTKRALPGLQDHSMISHSSSGKRKNVNESPAPTNLNQPKYQINIYKPMT